ncbi:MAG: hypothetical protein ACRD2R_08905 [Terriglobales bacterium]
MGISVDPGDLPQPGRGTRPDRNLEAMTRALERALQPTASFQGVAFHEYDQYRLAHCRSSKNCLPPAPAQSGGQ